MMYGQKNIKLHSMTFAQRRNRLTTHFSERIPVIKRAYVYLYAQYLIQQTVHITINNYIYIYIYIYAYIYIGIYGYLLNLLD
jgi:hypothetical protein